MTERQTIQLGIDATQVLDNEAFKQAFKLLQEAVLAELDACPVRDHEGRLLLAQLRRMSFKFEGILVGIVENGKLAKHQLELHELRNESKAKRVFRQVIG